MGKFIVLCLIAAAIYFGYQKFGQHLIGPSPAAIVFKQFHEAMVRDRYGEAKSLAARSALTAVEDEERKMTRNLSPLPGRGSVTALQLKAEMAGDITAINTRFKTDKIQGNAATIVAEGGVCRNAPGCMGARCGSCITTLYEADMCKEGNDWKVCSYTASEKSPPPR